MKCKVVLTAAVEHHLPAAALFNLVLIAFLNGHVQVLLCKQPGTNQKL